MKILWKLVYEECGRCGAFRWRFGSQPEAIAYWAALHPNVTTTDPMSGKP